MKNTLLLILFLLAVNKTFAQKNYIDQPFVETSAKVDTLVIPDRIYLTIIISEKDTKGKTSVEELESKMVNKLNSIP